MKLHFIKPLIPAFSLLLLWSCQPASISDPKSYLSYLADKSNGLAKEKTVAGITYKVKYLPAEYLAYNIAKEMSGISQHKKDSIVKAYNNSLTFILNIGPAENEAFDIMRVGIKDYAAFAERLEQMAFSAQNWMSIQSGAAVIKPSITRLENINALENSRNFIVVFDSQKGTEKDLTKNDMCFIYTDELFDTGTNKFIFKAEDLKALPAFTF